MLVGFVNSWPQFYHPILSSFSPYCLTSAFSYKTTPFCLSLFIPLTEYWDVCLYSLGYMAHLHVAKLINTLIHPCMEKRTEKKGERKRIV